MGDDTAAANLVRQLQLAYSGELAAAFAYAGHWRALHDPEERASIRTIEQDEWHHRRLVGAMLQLFEFGITGHHVRSLRRRWRLRSRTGVANCTSGGARPLPPEPPTRKPLKQLR